LENAMSDVQKSASARPDRLIGLPTVLDLTGVSKMTIRRMVSRGEFPAPVKVSRNRIAWREPQISAWMASLVEAA
jgi:prophage regulatory protein